MPIDYFHKLLFSLARHANMTGMAERDGYVHEVKKDKMRVVMGMRPDGTPWLSPWLSTSDHRGGSRERNMYVKGQNVRVSSVGGDYSTATISAGQPSKSFPAPAHADSVNGDTYQAGKLRISSARAGGDQGGQGQQQQGGEHFHDIWIADGDDNPAAHQDQSGKDDDQSSTGSSASDQNQQQQGGGSSEAKMKLRVSEKGYITGRVGKEARFAAHKDGVKIKHGVHAFFVDKDGIWATGIIRLKADPIPDDDS